MTAWLLAWLWQGTVLAVALSILLHLLPRVSASTRCVIWWGTFATLLWLGWASSPNTLAPPPILAPGGAHAQLIAFQVQPLPAWVLTLVVTAWITIALFRLLRILPGVQLLYRLKDECRPFPRAIEKQLPLWLAAKGRRVRLMICDRLPGAAVLGLLEPCIAVPSFLLRALTTHDLDQILLHEYAHVQRRDDWMRLLQALVESALWIHPATFLIGRELNLEREVACDDWVIARTRAPRKYAACLSRVAETHSHGPTPALAPAIFGGRRNLLRRVDRLLDSRRNTTHTPSMLAALAGVALVGACAVHLSAFPLVAESEIRTFAASIHLKTEKTDMTAPSGFADTIRLSAPARTPARARAGASRVAAKPESTEAPFQPSIAETRIVPAENEITSLTGARTFQGVYPIAQPPVRAASGQPPPWQVAANAGAGIGAAAKKASVGLATTFSRAGVSIGRSF